MFTNHTYKNCSQPYRWNAIKIKPAVQRVIFNLWQLNSFSERYLEDHMIFFLTFEFYFLNKRDLMEKKKIQFLENSLK